MQRINLALLLLGVTVAQAAPVPKDIARYTERWGGCNHFSGEEPYDKERRAEIDRALRKLRCNDLSMDGKILRHRYRNNKAALRLIRDAQHEDPG